MQRDLGGVPRDGRPVFVTRNGSGDLAAMSVEAYERLAEAGMAELGALLAEGRADAEAGRMWPAADVIAGLRRRIVA